MTDEPAVAPPKPRRKRKKKRAPRKQPASSSRAATLLTPEVSTKLCDLLRKKRPITVACDVVGIHRDTFRGWLERGEEGLEPYAAFLVDVRAARGEAQGDSIDEIAEAGKSRLCPTCECRDKNGKRTPCETSADWRAPAWIAERLYPELQLTTKHEVQVQQIGDSLIVGVRAFMSKEAYAELVTALARVQGVDSPAAGGTRGGAGAVRALGSGG